MIVRASNCDVKRFKEIEYCTTQIKLFNDKRKSLKDSMTNAFEIVNQLRSFQYADSLLHIGKTNVLLLLYILFLLLHMINENV